MELPQPCHQYSVWAQRGPHPLFLYETQVTLTLLQSERQESLPCCWRIRISSFFWNFSTTSCRMWTSSMPNSRRRTSIQSTLGGASSSSSRTYRRSGTKTIEYPRRVTRIVLNGKNATLNMAAQPQDAPPSHWKSQSLIGKVSVSLQLPL